MHPRRNLNLLVMLACTRVNKGGERGWVSTFRAREGPCGPFVVCCRYQDDANPSTELCILACILIFFLIFFLLF